MSQEQFKRFSPLALLGLAACGGSGSGGTSAGIALKGPLANAIAFVDLDGSKTVNGDETFVRTGQDGSFSLANPTGATIVVITDAGTTDGSSGEALPGLTFSGASTDAVISPFTSILADNPDLDTSALADALGLSSDIDLSTYNPYADGTSQTDADALAYEKVAQKVVALLQVAGESLAPSATGASAGDTGAAMTQVFNALAQQAKLAIDNGTPLNLDATTLATIVNQAAGELGVAEADKSALATKVSASLDTLNTSIDAVTTLDPTAAGGAFSGATKVAKFIEANPDAAVNVDGILSNGAPTAISIKLSKVGEAIDDDDFDPRVGYLSATDPNNEDDDDIDQITFSLSGDDAESFYVDENGILAFDKARPDFEDQSSYSITVTATDSFGESIDKALTIEVGNVDEEGSSTLDGTGAPIVGQSVSLDGVLSDPDNVIDGSSAGDFTLIEMTFYVGDEVVQTHGDVDLDEIPSLAITEAMKGEVISVKVTATDQGGFTSFDNTYTFGTAIPDGGAVTIQVFEDAQAKVEAFAAEVEAQGPNVNAMLTDIAAKAEAFQAGVEAFLQGGGTVETEVSSEGVNLSAGDYDLFIGFNDFNPTTLEGLNAAVQGFDPENPETWVIEGGFSELSFDGPDGDLFAVQFDADDWGSGDDARDVLRLVNQDAEGDVDTLGLIGAFENQVPQILEFFADAYALDQQAVAAYAQHENERPDYSTYDNPDDYNADFNTWVEGFGDIEAADNTRTVEFLTGNSDTYDLDGFFLSGDDGQQLYFDLDRPKAEDGDDDVVILTNSAGTFAIWGDFPDTFVEVGQLAGYVMDQDNYGKDGTTIFSELAEIGFTGVKGFGFYEPGSQASNPEPFLRVTTEDFQAAVTEFNDLDEDALIAYEFETEDGTESVLYDPTSELQFVGEGIDLATLYDTLDITDPATLGA